MPEPLSTDKGGLLLPRHAATVADQRAQMAAFVQERFQALAMGTYIQAVSKLLADGADMPEERCLKLANDCLTTSSAFISVLWGVKAVRSEEIEAPIDASAPF